MADGTQVGAVPAPSTLARVAADLSASRLRLPAENGYAVTKDLTIPGDVAGAWASDATRGLEISIAVLAGGGLQAARGWQGNDYMAPALDAAGNALPNGMATVGATFDIGAVRFTQGTAPQEFELPVYEESLRRCRRWLRKVTRVIGFTDLSGVKIVAQAPLDQPMRRAPTVTASAPLNFIIPGQGYFIQSAATVTYADFTGEFETGALLTLGNFSGLPAGWTAESYFNAGQYILFDARL